MSSCGTETLTTLTGPAFEKFTKATYVCEAAVQVVDEFSASASLFVTILPEEDAKGFKAIRA